MAKYIIRKLTDEGEKRMTGIELAELLRPADRREILAFTDDVKQEIMDSINSSDECWAAFTKEGRNVIAVWGIRKIKGINGRLIWCLGTYQVSRYWLPFSLMSKRILNKWAGRYQRLYNNVGSFNADAIKWLKWCGATFGHEFLINDKEYFIPFTIERRKQHV